jgi:hypothetical protein
MDIPIKALLAYIGAGASVGALIYLAQQYHTHPAVQNKTTSIEATAQSQPIQRDGRRAGLSYTSVFAKPPPKTSPVKTLQDTILQSANEIAAETKDYSLFADHPEPIHRFEGNNYIPYNIDQ